jgi:hypothetical protein
MSKTEPTTATESIARRDEQRLRHGRLGAIAIAFFVISAAAPPCCWATVPGCRSPTCW